MARPPRVNVEKGWYHAMRRGIARGAIFLDDKDRKHFLELVGSMEAELGIPVHGDCLMDNHYHLILHTPRGNLSEGMKWLGRSYANWFNLRHSWVGPVFQGRFKSTPVSADGCLVEIGEALGGKDYVPVALGIRRYEKRLKQKPDLRKKRDGVVEKLIVKT